MIEDIRPETKWKHRNGVGPYTVLFLTNEGALHPDKYPVSVVYEGPNGKRWSRPADGWHLSFERHT